MIPALYTHRGAAAMAAVVCDTSGGAIVVQTQHVADFV